MIRWPWWLVGGCAQGSGVALPVAATPSGDTGSAPVAPPVACTGSMEQRIDGERVAYAIDERSFGQPVRYRWDRTADGTWDTDLQNTYDDQRRLVEVVFASDGYGSYPFVHRTRWSYPDPSTAIEEIDRDDDGMFDERNTHQLGPDGAWRVSDQFLSTGAAYHTDYTFDAEDRVTESVRTVDAAVADHTTWVYDAPTGLTGTSCFDDGQPVQICRREVFDADGRRTYDGWDRDGDGAWEAEVLTEWDAGWPVHEESWDHGVPTWARDTTWDIALGLRLDETTAYADVTTDDTWTWTCE